MKCISHVNTYLGISHIEWHMPSTLLAHLGGEILTYSLVYEVESDHFLNLNSYQIVSFHAPLLLSVSFLIPTPAPVHVKLDPVPESWKRHSSYSYFAHFTHTLICRTPKKLGTGMPPARPICGGITSLVDEQ
jgi:hypothetical protein